MRVAVLGAGGYIGGRLVNRLLQEGMSVNVMSRNPDSLADRSWYDKVNRFQVSLPDTQNLDESLKEVETVYYLAHSLEDDSYVQSELENAKAFASQATHLKQIIFMGGIPTKNGMSKHIITKRAVAKILTNAAPCLEVATGPVIGSGSASYEILRDMVQRLPFLLTGKWGKSKITVIGIDDLLEALLNGAKFRVTGEAFCGSPPSTVQDLINTFAHVMNRSVRVKVFPFLPWQVAAEFANILTSVPRSVIRLLFSSLPHDTVRPNKLGKDLLQSPAQNIGAIVAAAIHEDKQGLIETRWTDQEPTKFDYNLTEERGAFRESVTRVSQADPQDIFRSILRIGGSNGWGKYTFLWHLRGAMDKVIGGPGYRRGRRNPEVIRLGDAIDFWRVRHMVSNERLLLEAEMKLPGKGFLVFDLSKESNGTKVTQTALFQPKGLGGWLYWWLSYPFHKLIFADLIDRTIAHAEHRSPNPTH